MKHILIQGNRNSGKTNALEIALDEYRGNIYGLTSRIINIREDDYREIYLIDANKVFGKNKVIPSFNEYRKYNIYKNKETGEVIFPREIISKLNINEESRMSLCNEKNHIVYNEVFENLGTKMLKESKGDGITIIDEIGFMEKDALSYQKEILKLLDSDRKVICTVRKKGETDFLDIVRNHKNTILLEINEKNREHIIEIIKKYYL